MKLPKPLQLPAMRSNAKGALAEASEGAPLAGAAAEANEEVSLALAGLKAREKREALRVGDATDSEFWCAFAFETREHKEAFLRALGLLAMGDKYLDGHAVAQKMNVELPARQAARGHRSFAPRWVNLAEPLESAGGAAGLRSGRGYPEGAGADLREAFCTVHVADDDDA